MNKKEATMKEEFDKQKLLKSANQWFIGIPQNDKNIYELRRDEIIYLLAGFVEHLKQPQEEQIGDSEWDDIADKFYKTLQSPSQIENVFEWLKENYYSPKRKKK